MVRSIQRQRGKISDKQFTFQSQERLGEQITVSFALLTHYLKRWRGIFHLFRKGVACKTSVI